MTEATDFAYAGARMQARYGVRPGDAGWNQLARIADFSRLVQALQGSSLAPWLGDVTATTDPHRIESGLRARFRQEVDELAAWLPRRWTRAVSWLRWLPDLAVLAHVRHGRDPWPWMTDDPVARALATGEGPEVTPLAGLAKPAGGTPDRQSTDEAWLETWRARRPGGGLGDPAALRRAEATLQSLIDRPGPWTECSAGIERRLQRLFRRHVREPAGAIAYVALLHIQFTRLRGLLLRRLLLSPTALSG